MTAPVDPTEPPGSGPTGPDPTGSDPTGPDPTGPGPTEPPAGTGPEGLAGGGVATDGRPPIGRSDDPRRPGIGWTEIAVAAVVYVVLQAVLSLAALLAFRGVPSSPWLVGLSAVSAFGAVAVAGVLRVRSWAALGLRPVRLRTVLLGVGVGLGVWVVSRALILAYVAVTNDRSDPQADLAVFGGPVSTVLVVVLGSLVVPLGEEMLFRGIGYGGLRRYGRVVAAVGSALVFALAHGLNVVFAAALLLGLVNAALYERTRSVLTTFAVHATFNLLSFVLALALR